jgi:uncharacterized membrane protein HdeD (DUF308 family)
VSRDREDLENIVEQSQVPIGVRPGRNPILAPLARHWWVELVLGVFWLMIAVVVLKFNHASVVTVGVRVGIMSLVFAAEELALATLDKGATRWLSGFFGILLLAAGTVSLIHPRETFAGFADILGFVFLVIGVVWTIQAFAERQFSDFSWMNLVAGILLIVLAFWTSAQFLLERAYTLLIFAGIWALGERHHRHREGVSAPRARIELTSLTRGARWRRLWRSPSQRALT